MKCKHCGSELLVKDGVVLGKQRWKCKKCHKTTRESDARYKYSIEKRLNVLRLYMKGMRIKAIERQEGVPNPLIIYWIKHYGDILKSKLEATNFPKRLSQIEILKMDELYSLVKNNKTESTFGLLWTETGIKTLILK